MLTEAVNLCSSLQNMINQTVSNIESNTTKGNDENSLLQMQNQNLEELEANFTSRLNLEVHFFNKIK